MLTTQQVAERANIHVNTVRKYTSQYSDLLSPQARGEDGARLFTDADVDTLCAVAALRRTGMHATAIVEQLTEAASPTVIDIAPTDSTQTPHAPDTDTTRGVVVHSMQHTAYMALHARVERVERNQDALIRAALVRGALWGAIGAFALGGFYLWVLYLFL